MKIKNRLDFFTGLGMIAFCCIVMAQLPGLADQVAMFPRAIMAVGIGIGCAVVIKSFLKEGEYGKANPGKITLGVPGGNNTYVGLQIAAALGFEATIVNGNNGNELYAQVLGGHIECAALGSQFFQNATDEGMLVLGDTENRTEDKEGAAPTFVQQGYDLVIETFTYLLASAETPDEICTLISDSVGELMDAGLKDKLDEIGQGGKFTPMDEMGPYVKEYNQKMMDTYNEINAAS